MFAQFQQLNVPQHDSNRFKQDPKHMLMIDQNTPTSSKSSMTKKKKKGNTKKYHNSKHNKEYDN